MNNTPMLKFEMESAGAAGAFDDKLGLPGKSTPSLSLLGLDQSRNPERLNLSSLSRSAGGLVISPVLRSLRRNLDHTEGPTHRSRDIRTDGVLDTKFDLMDPDGYEVHRKLLLGYPGDEPMSRIPAQRRGQSPKIDSYKGSLTISDNEASVENPQLNVLREQSEFEQRDEDIRRHDIRQLYKLGVTQRMSSSTDRRHSEIVVANIDYSSIIMQLENGIGTKPLHGPKHMLPHIPPPPVPPEPKHMLPHVPPPPERRLYSSDGDGFSSHTALNIAENGLRKELITPSWSQSAGAASPKTDSPLSPSRNATSLSPRPVHQQSTRTPGTKSDNEMINEYKRLGSLSGRTQPVEYSISARNSKRTGKYHGTTEKTSDAKEQQAKRTFLKQPGSIVHFTQRRSPIYKQDEFQDLSFMHQEDQTEFRNNTYKRGMQSQADESPPLPPQIDVQPYRYEKPVPQVGDAYTERTARKQPLLVYDSSSDEHIDDRDEVATIDSDEELDYTFTYPVSPRMRSARCTPKEGRSRSPRVAVNVIHYTISQDRTGDWEDVCRKLLAVQNKSTSLEQGQLENLSQHGKHDQFLKGTLDSSSKDSSSVHGDNEAESSSDDFIGRRPKRSLQEAINAHRHVKYYVDETYSSTPATPRFPHINDISDQMIALKTLDDRKARLNLYSRETEAFQALQLRRYERV